MNIGVPLIVIVLFLVIWVVTQVVRAQQEDAKGYKRNVNPRSGIGESKPLQQSSNTDIDRFLQEIDRLRKKSTDQAAEKPALSTSASPRTLATSSPSRATAPGASAPLRTAPKPKQTPARKVPRPASTRRVDTPSRPELAAKPYQAPQPPSAPSDDNTPTEVTRVTEVTAVTPVTAIPEITITPGISNAILGKNAQHKAANREFLAGLGAVLSSGGGPRMAVILTEIFGPPKAARKI